MDFPAMVRRLSYSTRSDNNTNPLVVPPRGMSKLTVDTSVGGNRNSFEEEPQWNSGQDSPTPTHSSRSATPSSTRSEDSAMYRRRRSNSECLFLAKNGGMQDLPGPCREYISNVKQILARSEESRPLARQRSMSLRNNPKQ